MRGPRGLARGLSIGLSGGPPLPGLPRPRFNGELPVFPPLLLPIRGPLLLWWCWLACIAACRFDVRLVDRLVERFVAIMSCCCECAAATMLHIWCRSPVVRRWRAPRMIFSLLLILLLLRLDGGERILRARRYLGRLRQPRPRLPLRDWPRLRDRCKLRNWPGQDTSLALPSPCAGNDRRGTLRLGSPRECARPAKRPAESFAACLYLLGEDLWRSSREMISIFSYINRIVYCFDFRLDAIDSIDSDGEKRISIFFSFF